MSRLSRLFTEYVNQNPSVIGVGVDISVPDIVVSQPWYLAGGAPDPAQANRFLGKASLAATLVNEVTPGVGNLVAGINPPTWATETGALFISGNVDTQYLRTGVTSVNGDVTAFVCFTVNASGGDNSVFGMYDTGNFFVQRSKVDGSLVFGSGDTIAVAGGAITDGTHTLAIAGSKAYIDGVAVAGTLSKSAIQLIEIYLGALNVGDAATQGSGCYITHWAFWTSILTPDQVAAVHTRAMAEATNP